MRDKLKNYGLGVCLFVFLFVILSSGFHLTLGAALIGALTGTPLVIYSFNRWRDAQFREAESYRKTPEAVALRERSWESCSGGRER